MRVNSTLAFGCAGDVAAYRFLSPGTDYFRAVTANGSTPILGVTETAAANGIIDCHLLGVEKIQLGATCKPGLVISDSEGRAVNFDPATAEAGVYYIGGCLLDGGNEKAIVDISIAPSVVVISAKP